MSVMSFEMQTREQAVELWPTIEPLVRSACEGNAIAKGEMDSLHVLSALVKNNAVLFVGRIDDSIACVLVIQFFEVNGRKGADVMTLAGRRLLRFKAHYWKPVLEWLTANGIEFLDAYTPTDRAEVYMKKFGFTQACAYIRMELGDSHE